MTNDTGFPNLDLPRILAVLDEHGVEHVVVGGAAGVAYGANRPTEDIDVVVRRERANLVRLAAALRSMNARLRVGGMSDEEAKQLPVIIDEDTINVQGTMTWTTDLGPLDVLAGLATHGGFIRDYEQLRKRATVIIGEGFVMVAANLADIIESKEVANRQKDLDALAELRQLRDEADARRE